MPEPRRSLGRDAISLGHELAHGEAHLVLMNQLESTRGIGVERGARLKKERSLGRPL